VKRRIVVGIVVGLLALPLVLVCVRAAWLVGQLPDRFVLDPAFKADAVLVPSGDPENHRTLAGARWILEDRARWLVISGTGHGGDNAELLGRVAQDAGVPADRIFIESAARTTADNMRFSRPILKQLGARSVVIPTEALHARRTAFTAEKAWPGVVVKIETLPDRPERSIGTTVRAAAALVRYALLGNVSMLAPWWDG
jgi:uncharacterized SAM-binding protein YcdF (DUF218 family)